MIDKVKMTCLILRRLGLNTEFTIIGKNSYRSLDSTARSLPHGFWAVITLLDMAFWIAFGDVQRVEMPTLECSSSEVPIYPLQDPCTVETICYYAIAMPVRLMESSTPVALSLTTVPFCSSLALSFFLFLSRDRLTPSLDYLSPKEPVRQKPVLYPGLLPTGEAMRLLVLGAHRPLRKEPESETDH